MATIDGPEITQLLKAWRAGDQTALERLTPLVYDRLRRLASHYVRRERAGQTLQRTALVHEAYVRLVEGGDSRLAGPRPLFRGRGSGHATNPGRCRARPGCREARWPAGTRHPRIGR